MMAWLEKKHYEYNVMTGIYMLDTWERCLFNVVILFIVIVTTYYNTKTVNTWLS